MKHAARTIRFGLLTTMAGMTLSTPFALGSSPCPYEHDLTRINGLYAPDASGDFWEVFNFIDNGAGPVDLIDNNDLFNFSECLADDSPGKGSAGTMIPIPDPTIMQIGEWYYITGTSDGEDLANFPIYKTRNFTTFELHMLAFGSNDQGVRSGQWITDNPGSATDTAHLPGGEYSWVWGGSLYQDPTDQQTDPWVHMTFSAALDHPATLNDAIRNDLSCFTVRIRESEFLAWHSKDPLVDDGIRFADGRGDAPFVAWFGYPDPLDPTKFKHDGGAALGAGRLIPASGRTSTLADTNNNSILDIGELEPKNAGYKDFQLPGMPLDPLLGPICSTDIGTWQWGYKHAGVGAATWMLIDATVWIDPNLPASDPWKRPVMYVWDGREGTVDGVNKNTFGANLAVAPLTSTHYTFDTRVDLQPIASARNATNPITVNNTDGCGVRAVDNGAIDEMGREWNAGGVAEGATAFYSSETERYYLLYTRNPWTSGAYQIVYRMTEPGRPFSDLFLTWGSEYTTQEYVLLRSYTPTTQNGASYGNPEVFFITDSDGVEHPYITFHAKIEGGFSRTVFFKELRFNDPQTGVPGDLWRLYSSHSTASRDIRRFKVPVYMQRDSIVDCNNNGRDDELELELGDISRCEDLNGNGVLDDCESFCPGDLTTSGTSNGVPDGVVDLSDYNYYLSLWSASDLQADLTTTGGTPACEPDGVVDLSDFNLYVSVWSENEGPCP